MPQQSTATLAPLLPLLQQPAFCLRQDGALLPNRAAQNLMPDGPEKLDAWLGDSAPLWNGWDHTGTLELPLTLAGLPYAVTVQPLADGTLFLLACREQPDPSKAALATASQVMRQPLGDLSVQLHLLSRQLQKTRQEGLLEEMAAINRQLYRLARISDNLADLQPLLSGQYHLHLQVVEVSSWLQCATEEAAELCGSVGRRLVFTAPQKSVSIHADPALLDRLFFNLISNALKFGTEGTPICCTAEVSDTQVLLRVQNTCSDGNQELLRAAFTRLSQRDVLPDPRWGMGLGLPLVLAIARAHGGMAAVEALGENQAAVTVRLPRRRSFQPLLESAPIFEYSGGMRRSMLELADCLPNKLFHPDAL